MEHTPPQEAAAQVWRAVLLTEQAHQAARAAAAAVAEQGQEYAHMRAELAALAEQSAPTARAAQRLGDRYLSLSGEHAQEYARAAAARAFALAVEIYGVQVESDADAPEDFDFPWHREQITAAGVMLARAAEWQYATHYHQAQAGRAAAARVARLETDPAYAARVAARARMSEERPGFDPEDIAAEVEQAADNSESAHSYQHAQAPGVVTVGWDAPLSTYYAYVEDPEAESDEDAYPVSLGGIPYAVRTVDELAEAMPYPIPQQIRQRLTSDRYRKGEQFGTGPLDQAIYRASRRLEQVTPAQVAAMEAALGDHGQP